MTATVDDLWLRYPALASASDDSALYWLNDAARYVTDAWDEADRDPATLAYAAHGLANSAAVSIEGQAPAGVTSFRSGSVNITVTEQAANQSLADGFGSTTYGREFLIYLRRNRGGPRLV